MKKLSFVVMLAIVLVSLVSCVIGADTNAPVFENALDNVLPEKNILVKTKTSEEDLIADVTATDEVDGEVVVVVFFISFVIPVLNQIMSIIESLSEWVVYTIAFKIYQIKKQMNIEDKDKEEDVNVIGFQINNVQEQEIDDDE